jgi:hypothetical protein
MSRPVLAVDVDGVVSLFGFEEPPDSSVAHFERVGGVDHCISLPAGKRLQRLSDHYDLVWASGWEGNANAYLPRLLGLPELPHLSFNGTARFGSAHWKVGPLAEYAGDRPLAWLDDSFDETCYEWARRRGHPTLLMPTQPHLGLEEVQVEALVAWARSFD